MIDEKIYFWATLYLFHTLSYCQSKSSIGWNFLSHDDATFTNLFSLLTKSSQTFLILRDTPIWFTIIALHFFSCFFRVSCILSSFPSKISSKSFSRTVLNRADLVLFLTCISSFRSYVLQINKFYIFLLP